MAELYAVADGKIVDKLEIKNIAKSELVCELPAGIDSVLLRPAAGYEISAGNSTWEAEFDADGFCNITPIVGSLPNTAYTPEKLIFNRNILPLYPSDDWQCSRIRIGAIGRIWIECEKSGEQASDVKAEMRSFIRLFCLTTVRLICCWIEIQPMPLSFFGWVR